MLILAMPTALSNPAKRMAKHKVTRTKNSAMRKGRKSEPGVSSGCFVLGTFVCILSHAKDRPQTADPSD